MTLDVVRLERAAGLDDTLGAKASVGSRAPASDSGVADKEKALQLTLHSLLRHLVLQSDDQVHGQGQSGREGYEKGQGTDQGRHAVDPASVSEAIATIVLHSLCKFDALVTASNGSIKHTAARKETNSLWDIVLLLKWCRYQQARQPDQTASVYEAVRAAVCDHPRGPELLGMLEAARSNTSSGGKGSGSPSYDVTTKGRSKSSGKGKDTKEDESITDAGASIFHNANPIAVKAAQLNGSRARFEAYTYDSLEMHDNDSNLETEYLQVKLQTLLKK